MKIRKTFLSVTTKEVIIYTATQYYNIVFIVRMQGRRTSKKVIASDIIVDIESGKGSLG